MNEGWQERFEHREFLGGQVEHCHLGEWLEGRWSSPATAIAATATATATQTSTESRRKPGDSLTHVGVDQGLE